MRGRPGRPRLQAPPRAPGWRSSRSRSPRGPGWPRARPSCTWTPGVWTDSPGSSGTGSGTGDSAGERRRTRVSTRQSMPSLRVRSTCRSGGRAPWHRVPLRPSPVRRGATAEPGPRVGRPSPDPPGSSRSPPPGPAGAAAGMESPPGCAPAAVRPAPPDGARRQGHQQPLRPAAPQSVQGFAVQGQGRRAASRPGPPGTGAATGAAASRVRTRRRVRGSASRSRLRQVHAVRQAVRGREQPGLAALPRSSGVGRESAARRRRHRSTTDRTDQHGGPGAARPRLEVLAGLGPEARRAPAPRPADPVGPISPAMRSPSKARSSGARASDHSRCQRGVSSHRRAVSPGGTGPLQLSSKRASSPSPASRIRSAPGRPGPDGVQGRGREATGGGADGPGDCSARDLRPQSSVATDTPATPGSTPAPGRRRGRSRRPAIRGARRRYRPPEPNPGPLQTGARCPCRTWPTRKGNPTTSRASRLSRKYHWTRRRAARPRVARPGPSGKSRNKAAAASRCSQTELRCALAPAR